MALTISIGSERRRTDQTIYRDLEIPVVNTDQGLLTELKDLSCIKNGIRNILTWQQGWRILNPEFGNLLAKYVAEPINETTSKAIKMEIETLLPKWEPRLTITNVIVEPEEDKNQYNITVNYSVTSLEVEDQLNFTLLAGVA